MLKISKILDRLESHFKMVPAELQEWNLEYFRGHKNKYKEFIKLIKGYYENGKILEIGSIPCHLTYCLKEMGYPVTGIDLNPHRMEEFIENTGIDVRKCDIERERLPFERDAFSFIIFCEVFEHLRINPIFALREINRVLKPGGKMILETPNLYYLPRVIKFNLGLGLLNSYKEFEKLHTIGHMGHIREYSTKEVREFLENTGFEVLSVKYKIYRSQRTVGRTLGFFQRLMDMFCLLFPKLRSHQIFICGKKAGRGGRNDCFH